MTRVTGRRYIDAETKSAQTATKDVLELFSDRFPPPRQFVLPTVLRDMLLLNEIGEGGPEALLSSFGCFSPKVTEALKFLEQNFRKGATVREAAEHVKMHPASLSKKIQKEFAEHNIHITSCEYLSALRVKKAIELVRSDQFVLFKEVAQQVGIGARDFRKIFKKHTGMTPTAYRIMLAEKEASLGLS